jgi:uncharacterized 2Fe-2S/4Fe-4S cluster protein (DUF4445 family)
MSREDSQGPIEFVVTFLPSGQRVSSRPGVRLAELARQNCVRIPADCGGRGRCRSCAVRIEGTVPDSTPSDRDAFSPAELDAGWRRACQALLAGPCSVYLPRLHTVVTGQNDGPSRAPIEQPILVPDREPGFWRRGNQRVGPLPGTRALGMAVDLGTSNIAAALLDLSTGEVLSTAAVENPQLVFSADVIGRMTHAIAISSIGRQMQQLAIEALSELAQRLTDGSSQSIAEVAVAGNSVMQHLLLGLPLETLARSPYHPYTLGETNLLASDLGLRLAPGAWVYVGPNIAAFIGSDHVAALLELMAAPPRNPWMLIDIGTNTEISVFSGGLLRSASCASGPAFEGGILSCGMRAAPGAVSRAHIECDRISLETIDHAAPVGICGSGVVSLVSEMHRNGVIDKRGRLQLKHSGVREQGPLREFVLAEGGSEGALPVLFTQTDIRSVQLAKAAIRTGLDLLLEAAGLREEQVERFVVAGAFGKYLDLEAAAAIGLLPDVPAGRIVQIGNAAGAGIRRMLVCARARERAHQLSKQAQYLDLASRPDFHLNFARRSFFI